jgi:hypothetical protein
MKDAVIRDLPKESRYRTEYTLSLRGKGSIRVDVWYKKKKRNYLVECETRPNIGRLVKKGKRSKNINLRSMHMNVIKTIRLYLLNYSQ